MEYPIRINKYLRDKGLASRRESDKLVESGLVFVNGKRAGNGIMVNEKDNVTVKGIKKEYKYQAERPANAGFAGQKKCDNRMEKQGALSYRKIRQKLRGIITAHK